MVLSKVPGPSFRMFVTAKNGAITSRNPPAPQSLDHLNELMKIAWINQNNNMEEMNVLRERGMLLIWHSWLTMDVFIEILI